VVGHPHFCEKDKVAENPLQNQSQKKGVKYKNGFSVSIRVKYIKYINL